MDLYPYLLAAHITAVIFLIGGMFAHDRIMIAIADQSLVAQRGTLAALYRFDRQIVTPALLLSWVFGLSLALWAGWFPALWLIVKLVFIGILSMLHGIQSGRLRRIIRDGRPARGVAGASLCIGLSMLTIAILAIAKPI